MGKYVYYRCTGFHGRRGNTYIREEELASLLGTVIPPIQIPLAVAEGIAEALKRSADEAHRRQTAVQQLEQRRRVVLSKLDRGYDDYVSGKISEESWNRKSQEWEAEIHRRC